MRNKAFMPNVLLLCRIICVGCIQYDACNRTIGPAKTTNHVQLLYYRHNVYSIHYYNPRKNSSQIRLEGLLCDLYYTWITGCRYPLARLYIVRCINISNFGAHRYILFSSIYPKFVCIGEKLVLIERTDSLIALMMEIQVRFCTGIEYTK